MLVSDMIGSSQLDCNGQTILEVFVRRLVPMSPQRSQKWLRGRLAQSLRDQARC
jgi:hypothetical protein